jgi:hypothetical protein
LKVEKEVREVLDKVLELSLDGDLPMTRAVLVETVLEWVLGDVSTAALVSVVTSGRRTQ